MTGRYRLVESIGQGGMGRVWRAADEMLDRPVAVKEMRIDGLDAEDTRTRRERTLREARATARIDHPNVVRVYDVVDEGERLWIVMELVGGRSLERIVAQDGPLAPGATARIGLGLVRALRQVHARGVLHRDIKPGNVLVEDGAERIVLTDFGIAAIQDAKALTMVGMLVGSPDYMAPERISGRPQGPPSDVWSLGATLCAALGGRSPFSRDTTLATLHAVLYEEPKLPAAAGPLRDVLAALLEKDPSVRPNLDDLEEALLPIAFPPTLPTLPVGAGEGNGGAEEDEADEPGEPAAEEPTKPEAGPAVPPERPTPVYLDTRLVQAARDPRRREPEPERAPEPAPEPAAVRDAIPQETPEPAAPSAHHHVNASSEVASEVRSEVRSEAPSAQQPAGVSLVRTPTVPEQQSVNPNAAAPGARRSPAPVPELSTRPALGPHPLRTPPRELPVPATPDGPRRPRRRAGLIAAGGLVAAGAVVAVVLLANSGSPGDNRADSSSSSAGTSSSSAPPTVEGTARPQTLPPGVHREAGGFAWATPKGWRRDLKTGSEVHYTSPDATQELVGKSSIARGDLMETWKQSEQNAHQGQNYQKIRLERTTFRGNPAVIWEYTFTLQGTPWHARLLGFDQEGKSYQISTWYQPDIETQALKVYDKTKDSFIVL
ncbi:protein kinase [Streptomyces sp. NPDC048419]|uniref:serine/threonine-protein kinase n=1 Tax=Streptomyces sp. NPDC048419 TaxID=3365547 RepID=UPI0037152288